MRLIHRLMAALVLVAGVLAGIVGSAMPPLAKDEVSALDLARWIVDHRSGLQLLDLRDQAAFDSDHLPGALLQARQTELRIEAATTLVVYGERSVGRGALSPQRSRDGQKRDSAQAADQRPSSQQKTGRPTVLRLRGGFQAWSDEVLFPTLRSDASESERRDFVERARLSRYFGGSPRILTPGTGRIHMRGRRGC